MHCTAGKDRTGIFSALFLLMVGVPYATVEEDYLLSNSYYGTEGRIAGAARSSKTSIEAARALLAVDKSYLLAALKEIDDRSAHSTTIGAHNLACPTPDSPSSRRACSNPSPGEGFMGRIVNDPQITQITRIHF